MLNGWKSLFFRNLSGLADKMIRIQTFLDIREKKIFEGNYKNS